ncbi:MAG: hydrogenase expression/formation protein [Rhodospirillales bacterium]|nr:hydrogenase expression/formation protein [Rhodospirillales bacterium]
MQTPTSAFVGPGSQPQDPDDTLDILRMPSGMSTFSAAHVPEATQSAAHAEGIAAGEAILAGLDAWCADATPRSIPLAHLPAPDRAFVRQLLGEGEVSVIGGATLQAQESVLAGVWYIRETSVDGTLYDERVEIGPFPPSLLAIAFEGAAEAVAMAAHFPENVFNAPALIPEISAHLPRIADDSLPVHVINLSLLPHTQEDLQYLDTLLGSGPLIILSRGYGNCRIRATATRNVWWVRYYNSQDTLILNAIELSRLPDVAVAAPEDLADSRERLAEIMDLYR